MEAAHEAQVTFYLTGRSADASLDGVEGLGLRPALFAPYRDLASLRYDFPLVLLPDAPDEGAVRSLSELFDAALAAAGEKDAQRLAHHARRMEREIRRVVAKNGGGAFSEVWQGAAAALAATAEEGFAESLTRLKSALPAEGEVADCDASLGGRLLSHAHAAVTRRKAERFRADLSRLLLKLTDILRADFVRSADGRSPENLRAAIGEPQAQIFDFEAMSRLLSSVSPPSVLSDSRRERIRRLISVLQSQRFYAPPPEAGALPQALPSYGFVFDSLGRALEAWRERLPRMVELVKAMTVAALEVTGAYREAQHDALFAEFGASSLSAAERARFPDYLVRLDKAEPSAAERARALEALSAGLPFKILVQTDDLLAPLADDPARASLGLPARALANGAIALADVFVLQSSASNLLRLRERLFGGLALSGPALFSVFSGASGQAGEVPPYLVAAAAMESRAFPAFVYDPAAGSDWALRFSIEGNPQPEEDWPLHPLLYEDGEHQRQSESLAFTAADFLACDRRFARHFARIARAEWNGEMAPAAAAIAQREEAAGATVPTLLMVDGENRLQKVVADEAIIREARRVGAMWRGLRELGGIENSHARRLLTRERAAWEEERRQQAAAAAPVPAAPIEVPAPAAAPAAAPEAAPQAAPQAAAEPERSPDEPYIETARCSSCNECTELNGKMFAYNKDKQAYIADLAAGSYRELVEAAESCQVSVIHPGKPRNPKEPGLDALLERAQPFL